MKDHNREAEISVLCSMMRDESAREVAVSKLTRNDFFSADCSDIFESIRKLHENRKAVDVVTVKEQLNRDQASFTAEDVLMDAVKATVVPSNIHEYVEIVKDAAVVRNLMHFSNEISRDCMESELGADELLDRAEQTLSDIRKNGSTATNFRDIEDVGNSTIKLIYDAMQNGGPTNGVKSGFIDLDRMTTGFHDGDLVLIAARPAMGKTAMVLNMLSHMAIREHKKCAMFSLEMSGEQLFHRMISMESGISSQKMRNGQINDAQLDEVVRVGQQLVDAGIMIDDTSGITVAEMKAKCRKLKNEGGLDIIIIDYLQLMSGNSREGRQQEISGITRALKCMARDLGIPVICLSQLNRACEARPDKRPQLSDLRDSGAIEQDADIVMFIYRDDYYNEDSKTPGVAEFLVSKHRNGATGTVKLLWKADLTKFVNMEK